MFCYQCEQTSQGKGCTAQSVCGKDETTANLQDGLFYVAQRLSQHAYHLRRLGIKNRDFDHFVVEALFTTVTNVNFDSQRVADFILKGQTLISRASEMLRDKAHDIQPGLRSFSGTVAEMSHQATAVSILKRINSRGADLAGLEELITYGLKGAAAYAQHARFLNIEDDDVYAFFHETLYFLTTAPTADEMLNKALKVGDVNLKVMEMLDGAHTRAYGHPVPTAVRVTSVKGKAILVSGHDMKDLEELLKQTQGKGINVYTHGEMLPAHGYPGLKKYQHLVGNYGGAWQDQQIEFERFPGAILMTTNCMQKPRSSYQDRIFTGGLVAWPGVKHIAGHDYSSLIEAALGADGFAVSEPEKNITVGFGHNAVLSVADKVIDAVKSGVIKHFYLIGGCDGAKSGRNYYTEFAQSVPKDAVILTLACGKYRFNKLDFGTIGGIPRLLDIGQCNDAYSAIQIAVALAKAFETDVNSLPLSMILSWYEQKAVAILLTLLHLGIKNIRLGPSLPAFVTPNILNILVEKFKIRPIGHVKEDLAETLA
ncbi:MAG: hydroxylamine reductase [Deltaproteobacteria bacterium]|nr:hydroxylamine reductase [Deltaproteobacteria bacterium]